MVTAFAPSAAPSPNPVAAKAVGFTAAELRYAGFTGPELQRAGFPAPKLTPGRGELNRWDAKAVS